MFAEVGDLKEVVFDGAADQGLGFAVEGPITGIFLRDGDDGTGGKQGGGGKEEQEAHGNDIESRWGKACKHSREAGMIRKAMEQGAEAGYPVVLRLAGKRCVVFGTGHEAETKAAGLREVGAVVVSAEKYDAALIEGSALVVAAGPDRTENPRIFADCEARGILVNCLDDPPRCRFTYPSVHRQGDLLIAVSTSGACPALAVRLRERFAREFGEEYGRFLRMCRGWREKLVKRYPKFGERKAVWYRIVDSRALGLLKEGKEAEAAAEMERAAGEG